MAESGKAAEWVYKGVWAVLVRWFAVPDRPPDLPVARTERLERFRPAPGFVRYLKFWFWIALTTGDAILTAAWIASFFVSFWLGVALLPVYLAVAVLPDIVAYAGIHLRYDTTWYVLSDRSMRIRRGIWTIHETTITFENVQNVKIQQGPVQRYFGIADVMVETAGGGAKGHQQKPGAPKAHTGLIEAVGDAHRIRDLIMAKVRQSRSAGLGDDLPPVSHRADAGSPAWTNKHVELLREIRDEVQRLRRAKADFAFQPQEGRPRT
jgi:membrane protein YdbS with pleckstrin-like domain